MTEKWTRQDNVIARFEMKMSRYLTAELAKRPVRLRALLQSQAIQRRMGEWQDKLEKGLDRKVHQITARTYGVNVREQVYVVIEMEDEVEHGKRDMAG